MNGLEYILLNYNINIQELTESLSISKDDLLLWIERKKQIPESYLEILSEHIGIASFWIEKELEDIDKYEIQRHFIKKMMREKPEIIGYSDQITIFGGQAPIYKGEEELEEINCIIENLRTKKFYDAFDEIKCRDDIVILVLQIIDALSNDEQREILARLLDKFEE